MEQKFDGQVPKAELKLEGQKVTRSDVTFDWGMRLQWKVSRDGKVIATPPARVDMAYEHPEKTPGHYEIVLQTWKYVDYRKDKEGEFTKSAYIDISNVVAYDIK